MVFNRLAYLHAMYHLEVTMTTIKPIAPIPSENDQTQVIERPDGFYWQDKLTEKLYGPFPTRLEAVQDMEGQNDNGYEEGESLEDAEAEIGIADWIDPETGEPAEGVSPRLSDD
jgi:hypothetical protein